MGCGWGEMNAGKPMCNVLKSGPGNGTFSCYIPHLEARGFGGCSWSPAMFPGRRGE